MDEQSQPAFVTPAALAAAENRLQITLNAIVHATVHLEQRLDQFEERWSGRLRWLDDQLVTANQRLDGLAARMNAMEQRLVAEIERERARD